VKNKLNYVGNEREQRKGIEIKKQRIKEMTDWEKGYT
jgi:hypothetical protein